MTPEFSRPEQAETIGEVPRMLRIVADPDERRRLAGRFGLVAIERIEAEFTVRRDALGVLAEGRVRAAVTQACSVTGGPVAALVDEAVSLRFVEAPDRAEEVELDDGEIDSVEIEDGAIDLGEVAAETMALALDPYPRGAAAEEALRAAGVIGEDEAGASGAFAALKGKLTP